MNILQLVAVSFLVLFSTMVSANQNVNTMSPSLYPDARFTFGQVSAGECYNGCTINYSDIEFRTTPIVFLMSSINPNKLSDENPSAAFVQSVGTESATIVQKMPLGFDNNESGMEPIFYLVAEPGYVKFDPNSNQKALVDTIDTHLYQKAGGGDTGWKNVVFDSSFGNIETPIVLTQVQELTQDELWATPAIKTNSVSSNGFDVALELGRRNIFPSEPQTIGYIAALPQTGTTENNEAFVFSSPSGTFRQPKSLSNSCNTNYLPLGDDFSSYGVILSKQSRTGGDGGWLRLCDLTKDDQFSFIFEEDSTDRKHGRPESVGFFAFEVLEAETVEFDVCEYFPGALQSNRYYKAGDEWVQWDGSLTLSGGDGGGNRIYFPEMEKSSKLAFVNSSVSGNSNNACVYKNGEQNEEGACPVDSNISLFPSGPPEAAAFQVRGSSITPPDGGNITLSDGGNYTEFNFGRNGSSITLESGEYWVGELKFYYNDIELKIDNTDGPVILHYNKLTFSSNQIARIYLNSGSDSDSNYNPDDFILVGHGENSYLWPQKVHDLKINGHLYISPLGTVGLDTNAATRFQLTGSVTSPKIILRGTDTSFIRAKQISECATPEPETGIASIIINPNNFHLTCENSNKVYIYPFDDDGLPMSDVGDENVEWSNSTNDAVELVSNGFNSAEQRFEYTLLGRNDGMGNDIGQVPVSANVVGSSDINDNDELIFVPFRFVINNDQDIPLIAGKQATAIPIEARACSDETNKPISGEYDVKLDNNNDLTLVSVKPQSGDFNSLTLSADLSNGQGTMSVQLDESGQYEGQLKAVVQCSDFEDATGCEEQDKQDVVGQFTLKSRPWTFAVCSAPSINGTGGDSQSGLGFVAAGESFNLYAKPIIFSSDHNESDLLNQRDSQTSLCTIPATSNFFIDESELNTEVALSDVTLASPENGAAPQWEYDGAVSNVSGSSEQLEFTGIKVSEVGSFHFKVTDKVGSFYAGILGGISPGAREIGRFYPKYFQVSGSPTWYYPTNSDNEVQNFAYMNQPFRGVTYSVETLNANYDTVLNYANSNYSRDLRASFALFDPNYVNRFKSPSAHSSIEWSNSTNSSIGDFTYLNSSPSVNCNSELCWVKADLSSTGEYADGPFNDGGSTVSTISLLAESGHVDPVEFVAVSEEAVDPRELSEQPIIRFGRAQISDVGGVSGEPLTVPLLVEFWDGSAFSVHSDDNFTEIGSNATISTIWSEDSESTTVTLSGTADVDSGESRDFIAQQTKAVREQVNAEQALSNHPWLRFDWDTETTGEEDPSAVVTFGIYRGNDRVIYRGESGLTGQ